MSKGDSRRPSSVSKEEFDKNFEALFGKKKLNIWEDPDEAFRPTVSGLPERSVFQGEVGNKRRLSNEQEECNDEQVDGQETTPSTDPEAAGGSPSITKG